MNSLSWLIYFIGVVDTIGFFALWLVIPATIGLFVVIMFWLIMNAIAVSVDNSQDVTEAMWLWWRRGKNLVLSAWLIGWFFLIVIPSRQTLMLIAGSEFTVLALKSEAVQGVVNPGLDLLKEWMKVEANKLKPKAKE